MNKEVGRIMNDLKSTLKELEDERYYLTNALEDVERYKKSIIKLEQRVRDSVDALKSAIEK